MLTEQQISKSWRQLFSGAAIEADAFDRAEALIEELRPESPLRHRLACELDELRAKPESERDAERLDTLTYRFDQFNRLEELSAAHAAAIPRLRDEVERTLAWLRPRIENKICLIGYTATALADMTPIPTNPRAPGVITHANLLSGLLLGRGVRVTTNWQHSLLALAVGLIVTAFSATRRPRTS